MLTIRVRSTIRSIGLSAILRRFSMHTVLTNIINVPHIIMDFFFKWVIWCLKAYKYINMVGLEKKTGFMPKPYYVPCTHFFGICGMYIEYSKSCVGIFYSYPWQEITICMREKCSLFPIYPDEMISIFMTNMPPPLSQHKFSDKTQGLVTILSHCLPSIAVNALGHPKDQRSYVTRSRRLIDCWWSLCWSSEFGSSSCIRGWRRPLLWQTQWMGRRELRCFQQIQKLWNLSMWINVREQKLNNIGIKLILLCVIVDWCNCNKKYIELN